MVPMHLGLIDGPFVPHNLISDQDSPVLLPNIRMAHRIKILISLGPREEPRYTVLFFLKESQKVNPLQVAQWGPYRERYLLAGHFYISLNISLIVFLSQSPVREPPPCSLTGFPSTRILCHQSHWPSEGIVFIHSFIQVCMLESPKRSSPTYIQEKHKVTVHGDGMPTYSGVRPGSPRGSLTTLLSLPQCHAAFSMIPSTLAPQRPNR